MGSHVELSPVAGSVRRCGSCMYLPVSILVIVRGIEMTPAHLPEAKTVLRSHLPSPGLPRVGWPRSEAGTHSGPAIWSGQLEERDFVCKRRGVEERLERLHVDCVREGGRAGEERCERCGRLRLRTAGVELGGWRWVWVPGTF